MVYLYKDSVYPCFSRACFIPTTSIIATLFSACCVHRSIKLDMPLVLLCVYSHLGFKSICSGSLTISSWSFFLHCIKGRSDSE